eukprot:820977-Alexandrium_andersonii.AAC.1
MSASLVGSEMCIRDRSSSSGPMRPWSAQLATANRPSPWPRSGLWGRLWAVSYTHLTLPTICSV